MTASVLALTFASPNRLAEANPSKRYLMDPYILQVMIFVVVLVVLVGGFALLFPLTRRLAAILEKRYLEDGAEGADADEVAALRRAMHALRGEVERIGERQDFTEKLLEPPKSED